MQRKETKRITCVWRYLMKSKTFYLYMFYRYSVHLFVRCLLWAVEYLHIHILSFFDYSIDGERRCFKFVANNKTHGMPYFAFKINWFFFIHLNTITIENIIVLFQAHHVKISLAWILGIARAICKETRPVCVREVIRVLCVLWVGSVSFYFDNEKC